MKDYNVLLIAVGIILILSIHTMTNANGLNYFSESENSTSVELLDKMTYMCMQMDALDGLDKIADEDKKQQCIELLDRADYFDRQELIQRYGEFDD
jgi:hypothetical protein